MASENVPSNTPDKESLNDRDRWLDAVIRMIELTQSGDIEWTVGGKSAPGEGRLTTPPYYTEYRGKTYKLEERLIEAQRPTTMPQFLRAFGSSERDYRVVNLDLVGPNGLSLYSVPDVSALGDLLDTVQKQTAADDALHDLLS